MIRRITGQLPAWANRDHPILRYELARTMPARSRRNQITRGLVMLLAALLLLGGGYLYATDLLHALQMPTLLATRFSHELVEGIELHLDLAFIAPKAAKGK